MVETNCDPTRPTLTRRGAVPMDGIRTRTGAIGRAVARFPPSTCPLQWTRFRDRLEFKSGPSPDRRRRPRGAGDEGIGEDQLADALGRHGPDHQAAGLHAPELVAGRHVDLP